MEPLVTYVVNFLTDEDELKDFFDQFRSRNEFQVNLLANRFQKTELDLWKALQEATAKASESGLDQFAFCSSDHVFTPVYSLDYLHTKIDQANFFSADVLVGGIYHFENSVPVSASLRWVERFKGSQFMVIFKSFYPKILESLNFINEHMENHITDISNNILISVPFFSMRRNVVNPDEFNESYLEDIYNQCNLKIESLYNIERVYKLFQQKVTPLLNDEIDEFKLPTYVINLPSRPERLAHICNQFSNKPEFELNIIDACYHPIGALGLWLSIRKIINLAIANNDDMIIICEDDHEFTKDYQKYSFLRNILEAYEQNTDFITGGTSYCGHLVQINDHRFWISSCLAAQFVVIYRKMFQRILDFNFDDNIIADRAFSAMAVNKMVLHPFVSVQKDFGYSDVTPYHNEHKGVVQQMFSSAAKKIERYRQATKRFGKKTS